MMLPPVRSKPIPHGFAEIPIEDEEDSEPNFDIPQSREEKPESYPNGPICIYESGVDLYYEPTVEEALKYDVIMNVASEVKNPFTVAISSDLSELAARRQVQPQQAEAIFSGDPAALKPSTFDPATLQQSASPTTPKAATGHSLQGTQSSKTTSPSDPEYIHIPWEHNTDIVPDLFRLVKLIDDRVQCGKRVLVHCQCGVSRSASLIVAYGLYKNPGISVQEAYDAVKKRSKWIGPNMSLIMQLQEFRDKLMRTESNAYGARFPGSCPSVMLVGASPADRRAAPFNSNSSDGNRTPRTAPLPPPDVDSTTQRASTGNMPLSAHPSSAPLKLPWSPGVRHSWEPNSKNFDLSPASAAPQNTTVPYVDTKGHVVPMLTLASEPLLSASHAAANQGAVEQISREHAKAASSNSAAVSSISRQLPFREKAESADDDRHVTAVSRPPLMSPQTSEFHLTSFKQQEQPEPDFGLLSPRAAEFSNTPFHFALDVPHVPAVSPVHETSHVPAANPEHHARHDSKLHPHLSDYIEGVSHEESKTDLPPPLASPRATEFHMTPFHQSDPAEDFGLLSPGAGSFPTDAFNFFATHNIQAPPQVQPQSKDKAPPQHRQPHSILHQARPEHQRFNSIASVAESFHTAPSATPSPPRTRPGSSLQLEVSPTDHPTASDQELPPRPKLPHKPDQLRLQPLQMTTEANSPNRLEQNDSFALDALLSPRTTEFTRNPFHVELSAATASQETIIRVEDPSSEVTGKTEATGGIGEGLLTDGKDPRSPPVVGGSPVVRNIWDVL
ncbi:tyrosine/serine/threonine protein phosphatase [Coniosporium apollinis]|uniref:protein-tyrosine-phosphatase n=1 Tax=Coniosporium apollinis TaxID=61459 RepID=A0ABQ9NJV2_9PEZI|nr:tyrosine/serine/threonine protein phosphatase [Coniosporium apollinis]